MGERAVVRPLDLPAGSRTLVVSDIHGNLPLLKGVLEKARFSQEDTLIVLGDILERSEGSLDTLRYIMALGETHRVYTVMGNCDNVINAFFRPDLHLPDAFYQRWFGRLGERSVLVKMAHLAGARVDSPDQYPAARRAIAAAFPRELAFVRDLPHILVNDHYLLVHGGVPREDRLEELSAFGVMKNDDFLGQGRSFRRWVIVGHWPVTLYDPRVPSAAPILLEDRHVASIDGGCTLKWDGQLNALILPPEPGGPFSWVSFDGFPTVTALESQAPNPDPVNVRFGHSELEVLEAGEEFCLCRHVESGRTLSVLTEYIYRREGKTFCEDSTDYRLGVRPGDELSLVRRTSRGLLAKKNGVTGWYLGRWE